MPILTINGLFVNKNKSGSVSLLVFAFRLKIKTSNYLEISQKLNSAKVRRVIFAERNSTTVTEKTIETRIINIR